MVVLGVTAGACGGKSSLDVTSSMSSGSATVTSSSAATSSGASTSSGGGSPACSAFALRRLESLQALALDVQQAKAEITEGLADTCFDIAAGLGQGPTVHHAPQTIADVRASCAEAVSAIDALEPGKGADGTVTEGSCGCARDAEAYFGCLEPCELLNEGGLSCVEVCYCQAYCEALGMVRPRCSECTVTVTVGDEEAAATVGAQLPMIYSALNRADLGYWAADMLIEASREFGYHLDSACSAELTAQLDGVVEVAETCMPELVVIRDQANAVSSASEGF